MDDENRRGAETNLAKIREKHRGEVMKLRRKREQEETCRSCGNSYDGRACPGRKGEETLCPFCGQINQKNKGVRV